MTSTLRDALGRAVGLILGGAELLAECARVASEQDLLEKVAGDGPSHGRKYRERQE